MKKICRHLGVWLIIVLGWSFSAFADSPLTSTPFFQAYVDHPAVWEAARLRGLNQQLIGELSSLSTPLDVKVAIVNALGWSFEGQSNAEYYSQMVYKRGFSALDRRNISAEDMLILGYLKAMDNYFETDEAVLMVTEAKALLQSSLTARLVSAMVESQGMLSDPKTWPTIWETVASAIYDQGVIPDMRQEAVQIIVDYHSLYSDLPIGFRYDGRKTLHWAEGTGQLFYNGVRQEQANHLRGPVLINGVRYFPLRQVVEYFPELSIHWTHQKKEVIVVERGNPIAVYSGVRPKSLGISYFLANNRLMVPLSLFRDLGFEIDELETEIGLMVEFRR